MNIDPELFRLAIEQTRDYAVFLLDLEGRVITWNAGAKRLKGYEAAEIIGRHFSIFYPPEIVESGWPERELATATAEGQCDDEGWRIRKGGSRFWASVVITALRNELGVLLGFSKITRDLTERKMSEEALAQSEERFRLLVEGVVDYAIYMLDPDGVITSWNSGAEHIKGYKREEVIGKHVSNFFIPEDVEAHKPWQELATARKDGRAEVEGWRVKKNGGRFWARVVVTALYSDRGELLGYAKVTQDLTERRHLQALEETAKDVNAFIAVLAHELRNPLAAIRAALPVLREQPTGSPVLETMHDMLDRQSDQLARIVDDMMDVARLARGELRIEREVINLNDVVEHGLETAGPAIAGGKHHVDLRLSKEPIYLLADRDRVTQVLANLLDNAASYTPRFGTITVRTRKESAWAELVVRDDGQGIEEHMLERIFDMFVHGRTATEHSRAGLGVGLAISRAIAELHNGSLIARSAGPNRGSEFILRLPAGANAQVAILDRVKKDNDAPLRKQRPARVLIVDDNTDAAIALEMLLAALGHHAQVVHDGISALKAAVEFKPHIVLLDIGLPDLNGYEVARRLRGLNLPGDVRIVAITGWGQDTDKRQSVEAGIDIHLVKPVGLDDLAPVLAGRGTSTEQL